MWRIFLIIPLLTVAAIRVPVESGEDSDETVQTEVQISTEQPPETTTEALEENENTDTSHEPNNPDIDSYLIPPKIHIPQQLNTGVIVPATYLLPPAPDQKHEYYLPLDAPEISDWLPMPKQYRPIPIPLPKPLPLRISNTKHVPQTLPIVVDTETQGTLSNDDIDETVRIFFPPPSEQLEPPLENSPTSFAANNHDDFTLPLEKKHSSKIAAPSLELQLPFERLNLNFKPQLSDNIPVKFHIPQAQPTLSLQMLPPRVLAAKYPNKLYPKKYIGNVFRPTPIPIGPYNEPGNPEVPKAKPLKPLTPAENTELDYPPDDTEIYQYEKAEQKHKLAGEDNAVKQQDLDAAVEETYANKDTPEQDASESQFGHPGRNTYPAPLKQAPPRAPLADGPPPAGDRTEFRMHGMNGPHSYQFGYDTGKGKNRQFRFEERDNDGRVRGHYGYMDRDGKMRVVNYNADPESGFHAEEPQEKP